MATTYKVLGQSNPAATTNTNVYTVPANTQTIVSTIAVCNLGATVATYRIAIRPAGEALANKHYIAYDSSVTANNSIMVSFGGTLGAGDVITIYSSGNNIAFTAFGSEIA